MEGCSKPQPLLQKTCLSYASKTSAAWQECTCVTHALAYVCRPRATLAILFSKIDFFLFKRLYFYSSQFNSLLGFKLALLPLDLEFEHHWGMGARVIRGIKCGVYSSMRGIYELRTEELSY